MIKSDSWELGDWGGLWVVVSLAIFVLRIRRIE